MLDRAALFGLLVFSFFSPFSISCAQIGLGIAFIGFFFKWRWGDFTLQISGWENAFFLFALAGFFSLSNAVDIDRGLTEMKKFLIVIVFWLPYWLVNTKDKQQKLFNTLIISSSLISFFSILKFVLFWSDKARAHGFFSMSLTFGEFFSLTFLLTMACLENEERPGMKKWLVLALLLQGSAVILAMARGAWIGLFFALTFLFRKNLKIFFGVFLVIICVLFMVSASNEFYRDRFLIRNKYDTGRFRIWQVGASILSERPIFGVGMNNVKSHFLTRATPEEIKNKWVFGHQHNNFLQFLVMTGLFGFVVFWWWLFEFGTFCYHLGAPIEDPWQRKMAQCSFALFLCFWGSGFTEYAFGDEEVAMLFFFLIGTLAAPLNSPNRPSP